MKVLDMADDGHRHPHVCRSVFSIVEISSYSDICNLGMVLIMRLFSKKLPVVEVKPQSSLRSEL